MRRLLNGVYRTCGALAAFCTLLIAVLVVAQVGGRLVGVLVPGADDLAGYALTASSFLALAHTLRANGHIRLTLLIRRAGRRPRLLLESGCLAFAMVVTGYFAYHVLDMAWDAYRFGERSQGILSVPLWIPQAVMAVGAIVLFVAFVDDLVVILMGDATSYERAAAGSRVAAITREG